jgi:hypothetical protein
MRAAVLLLVIYYRSKLVLNPSIFMYGDVCNILHMRKQFGLMFSPFSAFANTQLLL